MIKRKVRVAHSRPPTTCNCLSGKLQCVGIRCGRWTWPQTGGVRSSLQSLPDLISLYVAKLLSVARSHQSLCRRRHLQIWGRSDLRSLLCPLHPTGVLHSSPDTCEGDPQCVLANLSPKPPLSCYFDRPLAFYGLLQDFEEEYEEFS